MNHILRNNLLEVRIDDPLENYQTSRFDWTGKISEVKFLGIPMTITEKPDGQHEHLFGKGLYNEFSMDTALGFEEADLGGWFHKIGIGLLKKDSSEYEFFKPYEIKPATFHITAESDRITINCISDVEHGYAYILKKEFQLTENQLKLHYTLENCGEKDFEVEEYVHNFMSMNKALIDPNYVLRFPFQIGRLEGSQTVNPDSVLDIGQNEVTCNQTTEDQFFANFLNGDKTVEAKWELIHKSQNLGVRESTSFPTNKVNLWGWKHVISPELFHQIYLKPSEKTEWTRLYEFFEVA